MFLLELCAGQRGMEECKPLTYHRVTHPVQMTFEQSPKEWQSLEKMTTGWWIQSSRPQFPRAQAGVIVYVAVCGMEVRDWSAPCRLTTGMTPLVWLSELGNGDSHVQAWRETVTEGSQETGSLKWGWQSREKKLEMVRTWPVTSHISLTDSWRGFSWMDCILKDLKCPLFLWFFPLSCIITSSPAVQGRPVGFLHAGSSLVDPNHIMQSRLLLTYIWSVPGRIADST